MSDTRLQNVYLDFAKLFPYDLITRDQFEPLGMWRHANSVIDEGSTESKLK